MEKFDTLTTKRLEPNFSKFDKLNNEETRAELFPDRRPCPRGPYPPRLGPSQGNSPEAEGRRSTLDSPRCPRTGYERLKARTLCFFFRSLQRHQGREVFGGDRGGGVCGQGMLRPLTTVDSAFNTHIKRNQSLQQYVTETVNNIQQLDHMPTTRCQNERR